MSETSDKSLFEPDRRKDLRLESTDRRESLRPALRLKVLKSIVAAILVILIFVIIYIINPKV